MKAPKIEDRARTASRLLVERYYRELESEATRDRKVVYLLGSGSILELFATFSFRIVHPELNAVHCSRSNVAVEMIHYGEGVGYAADICGYVTSDLGLMTGPPKGQAPFGRIPPPDLVVVIHGGCSTHIKWGEALVREFDCSLAIVDVPFVRGDHPTDFDRAYVKAQIEKLVPLCEDLTGVQFDLDRLKETLLCTAESIDLFRKLLEYGKRRPSPIDGYFEAVSYMAPMTLMRGTAKAVEYYKLAGDQMEERISTGYSPTGEEKFRLLFEGSPPWPRFREFWEMFKAWGAVAVTSTYPRVVCSCEEIQSGPDEPFDFLVDLAVQGYYNWNLGKRRKFLERLADEYQVDGLVAHSVRSCRPSSIGQLDLRNYFAREKGIPALFIDSDVADPRFFSTAQIENRINTFFEALSRRKRRAKEGEKSLKA